MSMDKKTSITLAPNGPYVVSSCPDLNVTIWGEGASKQQYTLCRCDGSHWKIEFTDEDN